MSDSVTKNRLKKQQISEIVKTAFGQEIRMREYQELSEGFCNIAYRILLSDGRKVVLKVAPREGVTLMSCEQGMMRTEVAAMQLAAQQGLFGVPRVYAFQENSALSGSAWFIMECLEGESYAAARGGMTEEEQRNADRETGAYLHRLNQIKGESFGHFWLRELQWKDWFTAFSRLLENVIEDGRRAQITIGTPYEQILEKLKQHRSYFAEVKEPVLIHFDSWDGNIFVKDGHFLGMIDWERAMWAEGLMEDRFRYHTRNVSFQEGYGIREMTKAQTIRCAWYDVYLYLIMMFEGTYRHYETNDQYLWVHGLFEQVWCRLVQW